VILLTKAGDVTRIAVHLSASRGSLYDSVKSCIDTLPKG
jgi:hypothetical protein